METQNLLHACFAKGIISMKEFAVLYDVNTSKNPSFPYDDYKGFSLNNFSDDECLAEFRVAKHDLPVLVDALGIPRVFRCLQRSVFFGNGRFVHVAETPCLSLSI